MAVADTSKIDFATKRFLVVDDFDGMRNILREMLRRCGARQIDTAANGDDALANLMRNKYDIILCDYHLGPGKNGQQVLEEARAQNLIGAATVWAMITAEKTSDMVMGAVEHQPDDYLIKPLTEAMLQSRLIRLAARKSVLSAIEAAVRAKEYLKAIALCDRRLAEDPVSDAHVARLRCELLVQIGEYKKAQEGYEKQLAVRDTAWALAGLAKLHFREGNYTNARSLLEQVLDQNRSYLEGYDWLARTLGQMGENREAQAVLVRATILSPNSMHRQQALGEAALQCRDLDTAEHAYRRAVTLGVNSNLKNSKPYLGLARVHSEKGNHKEAFSVLGRLTQEVPGEEAKIQAKAAEVRVHARSGDAESAQRCAAELSSRLLSVGNDLPAGSTLELAEALMAVGDRETASQLIQRVVRNNHEDETLLSRAQGIFRDAKMEAEGATILEATKRQVVETMDKGVRLASQGKLEEGIQILREARTLMPNNARLLLNLAYMMIVLMEKKGKHATQTAEPRRCIETARKFTQDQQRCGQLLVRLEKLG